jgi:hypothetical protein
VLLMMLIYPALIYSDENVRDYFKDYMDFHTVTFHNLVVFASILIPILGIHRPVRRERLGLVWFMLGFCLISSVMAQLLKTNFNNFYHCNIGPLEDVRVRLQGVLGYGVTQLCYVLIVTCLDIVFVQGAYSLYCLSEKLVSKKKYQNAA